MASSDEADKVDESGNAISTVSKVSVGSNFCVNILVTGSLGLIWAMIEGLQVVSHMALFKIKSPGNVSAFNQFFAELASFDYFDLRMVTMDLFYFPEMDPISLNFQNFGFDTNLLILNLGVIFYLMAGLIAIIFVHMLLYLLAKALPKTRAVESTVSKYLYWNL